MKLSAHRAGLPGIVNMITGSASPPPLPTGRKAGHPADLPVTGGRAGAVFGETLCLPARSRFGEGRAAPFPFQFQK